jgi:YHS domain-containing protein
MLTKNQFLTNLKLLALIPLCFWFSNSIYAVNNNPIDKMVKPNPVFKALKSTPVYEGRGDGETTCPVTGEKIRSKTFHTQYAGRKVYFCCKGCYQRAKHNPVRYLKTTMAEQKMAVKAYLATAPKTVDGGEFCDE